MKTPLWKNSLIAQLLAGLVVAGGGFVPSASGQDAPAAVGVFSPMPAGILPGSPLAQVVKLVKAGVDEGLIQTYVTNSTSTFNLDPDKIIYLKDAGCPNDVVTEMMQRDTVLQAQMATVSAPPPGTPADASNPQPADSSPPAETGISPQPAPVADDGTQTPGGMDAPDAPVTLNNFYDDLAPYGNWVAIDGYGRCWQPGVALYNSDWQPYGDHGHWVYTDGGWYWMSDYAWGWGPFHYGRWFRDGRHGWCWSPDTVWGPSWVVWRNSDAYCGWAPLPPGAYYEEGVGYMYKGLAVGADYDFGLDPGAFLFVETANFTDPHPYRHRIGHDLAAQVYRQTTPVNGVVRRGHEFVNFGINPQQISQATHATVPTIKLRPAAGGTARALPTEPVFHAGGATYATRPQSGTGYLRTSSGTIYVAPSAPRYNNNNQPVVAQHQPVIARPQFIPPTYPQREEPRPEPRSEPAPAPEYRPNPEPAPPARPQQTAPVRTYTAPPAAVNHSAPAQQNNQPH